MLAMAAPPEVPQLDKGKFPQAPWLGRLWDLLRPFFERTSGALKASLTHGQAGDGYQPGNLLAFVREVRVPVGASFPLSFRNELSVPVKGLVVWAARREDNPDIALSAGLTAGAGVWIDWQNASEAGSSVVRIRGLTGLNSAFSYVLTVAVYGG